MLSMDPVLQYLLKTLLTIGELQVVKSAVMLSPPEIFLTMSMVRDCLAELKQTLSFALRYC